jgi:hypothetical protein
MTFFQCSRCTTSLIYTALFLTTTFARPTNPLSLSASLAGRTASHIVWSTCPEDIGDAVQCGTLSVPIDWDEPNGEHFDLGLVKLPATPSNTTSKIGSLFINPGGPGGSAAEIVALLGEIVALDEVFLD